MGLADRCIKMAWQFQAAGSHHLRLGDVTGPRTVLIYTIYNVCIKALCYSTEQQSYSWCIWSASLWNSLFLSLSECNTEWLNATWGEWENKGLEAFGQGEKRERGVCCDDDQRMKIEKQANKQSSVWESGFSETQGSCQVWCDRCSGLPPPSCLPGRLIPAQTLTLCCGLSLASIKI